MVEAAGIAWFPLDAGTKGIIVGLLFLVIAIVVLWKLRHFIVNSLLGVIALFLLQLIGINIPINLVTMIIAAVLGLVGVGLMVLLHVLGVNFAF